MLLPAKYCTVCDIEASFLHIFFSGIGKEVHFMVKPIREINRDTSYDYDEELVKKQRKLLVHSLVKDFYPSKFSARYIIQKRDTERAKER